MKLFHFLLAVLLVPTQAFSAQVTSEEEATKLAINAIHKYRLSTAQGDCGAIDMVEKPSYFEFVVRERHIPKCGGTRETGPRLFNMRVRKRDGQLTSDVYDGISYRPVDHTLKLK